MSIDFFAGQSSVIRIYVYVFVYFVMFCRTNEIISSTEIHDALKTNIITALEDTYKKYSRTKDASPSSWQWAVRSSGIVR